MTLSDCVRVTLVAVVLAFATPSGFAQKVIEVTWPTKNASPPPVLSKPASDFLPAFRAGLAVLSEADVVALALTQPAFLGLTGEQATELRGLCSERYRIIRGDSAFAGAPSALPYCYSARTPTNGLAVVYRPKESNADTPCLVFPHGLGGGFLWSIQLLAAEFPGYIVICPAYGISSSLIPRAYVSECLAAVEKAMGHSISRPTLLGLSAGGFGAVRVFTQSPDRFVKLAVVASYPPPETMSRFNRRMSVCFIAGGREDYVRSGAFERIMRSIRPRVDHFESHIVPDADHFFLLSHREETFKVLHQWLDPIAVKP